MFQLVWLVPLLPLAGFVVLAMIGRRIGRTAAGIVGVGSVALAACCAAVVAGAFIEQPVREAVRLSLYTWIPVEGINAGITVNIDALSVVMMSVITFVGFLILFYSTEYMASDENYSRFFAYMDLFVASMLILVLADNLLLLYLGWEGVGLCSYLLIGFWYTEPGNARAAMKAFIVTRVGDTALLVGLLLLVTTFGTLSIGQLSNYIGTREPGSFICTLAAALLLGGAVGKSAQLPLQVWLPDAMAGPTPVSALIHAATMVTAGVYLIARMHVLFAMAPAVQTAVAVIGAATLLMAAACAITQYDIKRVLAYSTMSQIGYMFLALGVGAWSAGIFHFMVHAFFKSLLFLAAGSAIIALGHEQNIFRMGDLRKRLPVTFWTFLIGAASMAAVPFVTAGFYSKDMILSEVWASPAGGRILWAAGALGAMLTAFYAFRVVFAAFGGEARSEVEYRPTWKINTVLVILAFFSISAGFIQLPESFGHVTIFTDFLKGTFLPTEVSHTDRITENSLSAFVTILSLGGIAVAYLIYGRREPKAFNSPALLNLYSFVFSGWGFDRLYWTLFVRPYAWFANFNRHDFIDAIYETIANIAAMVHDIASLFQSGKLRWYAMCFAIGTIILIALTVLL